MANQKQPGYQWHSEWIRSAEIHKIAELKICTKDRWDWKEGEEEGDRLIRLRGRWEC